MTARRFTKPEPIKLVGDRLLIDGEAVALLRIGLRASLRERLEELIGRAVNSPYEDDEEDEDEAT